jgi:hypothetical protein
MLRATHRQGGSMSASHRTSQPVHRTLHVVDLENLVGDPRATGAVVGDTFRAYLDAAGWQPGDHVIVASNPCLVREFAFHVDVPCNVHACRGTDGADMMLLSLAAPDFVARRYTRLVIGSGDGAFAALACSAQLRGLDVLIVSRPEACSRRLHRLPHVFLEGREEIGDAA